MYERHAVLLQKWILGVASKENWTKRKKQISGTECQESKSETVS